MAAVSLQYLFILMQNTRFKNFFLGVILLATLILAQQCPPATVKIGHNCVDCKTLENVRIDDVDDYTAKGMCPCRQGYVWSEVLLRCVPHGKPGRDIVFNAEDFEPNESSGVEVSRILQTGTCNNAQGLIPFGTSSACVNCRLLQYALGVTLSSSSCTCAASFYWATNRCYCSSKKFIDASGACTPCAALPTALVSSCNSCNTLFSKGTYGCVYCPNLANNGGSSTCCTTGFIFNSKLSTCVCSASAGYAINSNGICTKCATTDTNCVKCVNTYVHNSIYCQHGSLIPNYDTTKFACATGYAFKSDPFTGQILSCVCSSNSDFYQNGANCVDCKVALPGASVSLSNCQACAASAGFYQGSAQCIYCYGVSNSVGTATVNGCDCKTNYYWNSNTDNCECDFTLGYAGGAISNCIVCANVANTAQTISRLGCACLQGYKWNSATSTCDCDLASGTVFQIGGVCYDCSVMLGANGLGSDSVSCVCISGYFWNPGTNQCQCDSSQNYALLSSSYCSDCLYAPLTNGLGYAQGCVCNNNFVWSTTTFTCMCPTGYAMVGSTCTSCSSISGITPSDCNICDSTKGFGKQNNICALCSSQAGAGTTATNGVCTCSTAGQVWNVLLGACVCDWGQTYVTYISTTGTSYTCKKCPYKWSSGACACGFSLLFLNSANNVCSNCKQDPNAIIDANGNCVCKSGYMWTEASYPFRCVPGPTAGSYLSNGATVTYPLCSSLSTSSLQASCSICDVAGGFVLVTGSNVCLYCKSVDGASGVAFFNGCECNSGYRWNPVTLKCDAVTSCPTGKLYNPASKACDICDPLRSALVGSSCVSCQSDTNSIGWAATSASCACKATFKWTASTNGGSCSSSSTTCKNNQILIGSTCFLCPNTNNGAGTASNGACNCLNGYTWQATSTGGSCVCNPITSIVISGNCFACPTNTNSAGAADSNGGCLCKNNYVWSASNKACICDSTISGIVAGNAACFLCTKVNDPNFDGTIANGGCNCANGFNWQSMTTGGSCVCNSPSLVSSGKCVSCPSNVNTTGSFDGNGGCVCNNNFIWNSKLQTCICDASVSGIIIGGACFQCLSTNDPNFDGTIVSGGCKCLNGWAFTTGSTGSTIGYCACDSPKYIQNGICSSCPTNDNTTGAVDDGNGCACNKGYIWDGVTKNTCLCDASVFAFILGNGTCFQCLTTADPNFDGTIVGGTCHCANGFSPATNSTTSTPYCSCTTAISSQGICFSCPVNSNPDGKGGCTCSNGYSWDSVNLLCYCDSTTSIKTVNGTCFLCGTPNTYTSGRKNSLACTCTSRSLTWNSAYLMCDCGSRSALIVSGNSAICSSCNKNNNAASKANPFTCNCNSNLLTWNPTTGKCDCGSAGVLINNNCIDCDASRYANGVTTTRSGTVCSCLYSGMTWSSTYLSCVCSSTAVVFVDSSGNVFCQTCNSSIFALKSRTSPNSCACPSGSVWLPNTGCVCTGQGTIPVLSGSTVTCMLCDSSIYSSGPSADGKSCVCLGSLTWQSKTSSCGCSSKAAIALSNGQYFCSNCDSTNNAKTPLINATQCTCSSSNLIWYGEGYCGCSNPSVQVVVGSSSSATCVTCNANIYSTGKSSASSNTCDCADPVLTYNSAVGICDCGSTSALIMPGPTVYSCINCNNAASFVKAKYSTTSCTCVSSNLTWDPTTGKCNCGNSSQIIIVNSKKYSCSPCIGQYTLYPKTITTCSCMGIGLVFTASSTGGSCACPKNYVMLPTFTCIQCPGGVPTLSPSPYECKCATNSIWNTLLQKCVACGSSDIPNSNSTGGSSLACKCKTGYIWDVMTQTCITPCTANNPTCMNCNFPEAAGNAVALSASANTALTGSSTTQGAINGTYTNYATIKNYMCPCVSGFVWDYVRLRCFNNALL